MSIKDVTAQIDAAAVLPISDSTKDDLRSYKFQIESGTIAAEDLRYVVSLCARLLRSKDDSIKPASPMKVVDEGKRKDDATWPELAVVNSNLGLPATEGQVPHRHISERMAYRHKAGRILESTTDLKWLYFDIALRDAMWDVNTLVQCAWACAVPVGKGSDLHAVAARYVDKPLFHCTALRDLLIVKLLEELLPRVGNDPTPTKANWKARVWLFIGLAGVIAFTSFYVGWWCLAIGLVLLWLLIRRWVNQYENNSNNQYSIGHYSKLETQEVINGLISRVRRGGYDEFTLIEQIELLDTAKTPIGSAVPLSPITGAIVLPVVVPDFALRVAATSAPQR